MNQSLVLSLLASSLASVATAQVNYVSQERSINASAFDGSNSIADSRSATRFAPFNESIQLGFPAPGSAFGNARLNATLEVSTISGTGQADSGEGLAFLNGAGSADTKMLIEFDVPVDSICRLTGTMGTPQSSDASVDFFLTGASGVAYISESTVSFQPPLDLAQSLVLPAGQYTLDVAATSMSIEGIYYGGAADFDFTLEVEALTSRYCTSLPNASGQAASIDTTGTTSLSTNDFGLTASGLPAKAFGVFFYGTGDAAIPFGNGFLCVATNHWRLRPAVQASIMGGAASLAVDLTSPNVAGSPFPILAGETRNFQMIFRDEFPGSAGFNTTDAIRVTFVQ